MSVVEIKPFPECGRTLAISGVGQKSVTYIEQFLAALRTTGGLQEVIGTSLIGIHESSGSKIAALSQEPIKPTSWWRKLGLSHRTETTPFTPPVVFNDPVESVEVFGGLSTNEKESLRAVAHFVSYERGSDRLITQVLREFRESLPNIEHFAVVIIPPGDALERSNFAKVAQACPVDSLGMPVVLMDHEPPDNKFYIGGRSLTPQEVLLTGLAGLIFNRKVLPDINPHTYLDLLRGLFDASPIVGVGLHNRDDFYKFTVERASNNDLSLLMQHINYDLDEVGKLQQLGYTSLPEKGDNSLAVIVTQLPIPPDHKFWTDKYFNEFIQSLNARAQRRNEVISYGYLNAIPRGEFKFVPETTTRFYPTSFIPGWNFIMELVKDL